MVMPRTRAAHSYVFPAQWIERSAELIWRAMVASAGVWRTMAVGGGNGVVCLHVRRGDKLALTDQYPHLANETSPEAIAATLLPHVPHGTLLYIASNEGDPRFFEPLRAWYRVASLASFEWLLLPHRFLPSTLALVDYGLLERQCTRVVHTFADEPPRGFAARAATLTLSKSPR
jgi:hypothetical protein